MAYDAALDHVLRSWENPETGLVVSINRYGTGEPKLQIGPRKLTRRDGTATTTKPGRLAIADVLWLKDVLEEVQEQIKDLMLAEE